MHKLDTTMEDSWFCGLEHLYAYKAAKDVEWNSNYNLWNWVKHYTESTRNAGHAYDLNQSRIYRLARIELGENNEYISQELEPLTTDRYNQGYSNEEISLIIRAPHTQLSDSDQVSLDQILAESFDTSHPEFSHEIAMQNLQRNFCGNVALCKNCIMAKQKTELEQYNDFCQECHEELYPTPPLEPMTPPPAQVQLDTSSNELVKLLQQQVEQQAQIINLLQTQLKTFEHQAQTIINLQNKVNSIEQFYKQIGTAYQQQIIRTEESNNSSGNSSINF